VLDRGAPTPLEPPKQCMDFPRRSRQLGLFKLHEELGCVTKNKLKNSVRLPSAEEIRLA